VNDLMGTYLCIILSLPVCRMGSYFISQDISITHVLAQTSHTLIQLKKIINEHHGHGKHSLFADLILKAKFCFHGSNCKTLEWVKSYAEQRPMLLYKNILLLQ
jgi:hypothetical protein